MVSLVYASSASQIFSDEQLVALLQPASIKNRRLDVTGMLLYKEGNFLQAIEGSPEAVAGLYATICQDPRHRGILKLLEQPIQERQFPHWTMGFQKLDHLQGDGVPGYSDFLDHSLSSEAFRTDPSRAQKLLLLFRKRM